MLLSGWQLAAAAEVCDGTAAGVVWAALDEDGGLDGVAASDVAAAVVFGAAVGAGLLLAALVAWAALLAVGAVSPAGVPLPPCTATLMMISSRTNPPAAMAASLPLPRRLASGRRCRRCDCPCGSSSGYGSCWEFACCGCCR